MLTKFYRSTLIMSGLCLAFTAPAVAQTDVAWPSKPVRMVVAGAPGAGSDILGRLIGNGLTKALGQPVIIENKPGASGIISAADVVKSPADGYTLLFTNASYTVVLESTGQKTPYNLMQDFAPVVQIGSGGVYLATTNDFPASNLQEMVKHVKAHPDKYQYGTFGNASTGHLTMEWLKNKADLKIGTVPYKSTVQMLQDMQTGLLKVAMVDVNSSLSMIRAGRIKVLALSGTTRAPATPEVATMADQGYPFNTNGWYGILAPAKTPKAIIDRVNMEVNKILSAPESRQLLVNLNIGNAPQKTADEFAQTMHDDIKNWTSIVRMSGIKLEQ